MFLFCFFIFTEFCNSFFNILYTFYIYIYTVISLNYLRPRVSPSNKRHKNQNFRGNIVYIYLIFLYLHL